jgi:alpha-L-fucosidase
VHRRNFLAATAATLPLAALRSGHFFSFPTHPIPSPQQLAWHRNELSLFLHFGVNTFTDREWGEGSESPDIFQPDALDCRQWARAAKAGGFRTLILTAKHHDGFCLWPSVVTRHSVKGSSWRGGEGDIVREFNAACRAEGLNAGLYLSPWDRHEPSYGDSPRYNDYYVAQLTELLTHYGSIAEVWFDGANGEGPNGKRQVYDWPRFHRTVRRLQPKALMFSDAGPDLRWIGNEKGVAGDPNWCTVNPDTVPFPGAEGPAIIDMLQHGDPQGSVWRPGEADVSIRPGWFYHPGEDDKVRSVEDLVGLYFSSVGRNAGLLLNVPPTRQGQLHEVDADRLARFGTRLRDLFSADLARTARRSVGRTHDWGPSPRSPAREAEPAVTADWLQLDFPAPVQFDLILLQEAITEGQTVEAHAVEAWNGKAWTTLASGSTIGHKRLHPIPVTTTDRVRLTIGSALGPPRISRLALFQTTQ